MVTALHRLAHVTAGEKRQPASKSRPQADFRLQQKLSQALSLEKSQEQVPIRTWSNAAWAMAKLRLKDAEVFRLAADALLAKTGSGEEVRPQELANIVWSMAASRMGKAEIGLDRCITHMLQRVDEFEVQHISNIVRELSTGSADD
eukprot:g21749.t1